ncbi:MGMT family protein [Colwellia sp. UCD-KL20]|uniref:MGMT family protein n=1 Tax=Colwellia sp. UCD-KL20 TaxID=1917165 RepID=UPI0009714BB5|nr:MGMT family protein [Colwellia sp. UCD-KL20]
MVTTLQDVNKQPANTQYIKIWKTVQAIPFGCVASYGQVADLSGLPGRARLVGKALGKVPINGWNNQKIPWFRVINSLGKISFPTGSELFMKQKKLLQDEQVVVIGNKVKMTEYQWSPDLGELLFKLEF